VVVFGCFELIYGGGGGGGGGSSGWEGFSYDRWLFRLIVGGK
jgi:hypothetical protein